MHFNTQVITVWTRVNISEHESSYLTILIIPKLYHNLLLSLYVPRILMEVKLFRSF